jgi:hypothetical protein
MRDITDDVISTVSEVLQTATDSALPPSLERRISLVIMYSAHFECDGTFLNHRTQPFIAKSTSSYTAEEKL